MSWNDRCFIPDFPGIITKFGVLDQLHCWIVLIGIQNVVLCPISYSCFCNLSSKTNPFPFRKALGMLQFTAHFFFTKVHFKINLFTILADLMSLLQQNSTLQHYTLYKASDLCNCVKDLHLLCYNNHSSSLPAIREKYSQHKVRVRVYLYSFVHHRFSFWCFLSNFFVSVQICGSEVVSSINTPRTFPKLSTENFI